MREYTIIYVLSSSDKFFVGGAICGGAFVAVPLWRLKMTKIKNFVGDDGRTDGRNHSKKFQVILKIIEMTHYHSNHLANISDTLKGRVS